MVRSPQGYKVFNGGRYLGMITPCSASLGHLKLTPKECQMFHQTLRVLRAKQAREDKMEKTSG
jgi:hypothetical protein